MSEKLAKVTKINDIQYWHCVKCAYYYIHDLCNWHIRRVHQISKICLFTWFMPSSTSYKSFYGV